MESHQLTFILERETGNAVRYAEDTSGQPKAIGTLYVQKWLLGTEPPRRLTVTITDDGDGAEFARPSSVEDQIWDRILQRTGTNWAEVDSKLDQSR